MHPTQLHRVLAAAMSTAASAPARVHRAFAPLDPEKQAASGRPKLAGVVFDVDGTLCEPQNYMFQEMRDALAISKSTDILAHISSLPAGERAEAQEAIQAIERRAMETQVAQPGLAPLMQYLDARGTPKGICTRNFDAPVAHLLAKFLPGSRFEPVVTREFEPPKPHPAGVLECARTWGVRGADVVMVGDSSDDMVAGRRAGAMTVLLVGGDNQAVSERDETDAWVRSLAELKDRLAAGLESGGPEL